MKEHYFEAVQPMKHKLRKSISVMLAVVTMMTTLLVGMNVSSLRADAAGWNGTNYSGGTVYGYRTFLEAFGIDYDTYMKWMDDHDDDSPNPDYYLGTRYVGYDHRNPHGDCQGAYGSLDTPGVEALNCTGFVWHVLYKSAVHSGASRSQINSLPIMGNVTPTWSYLGVYRIYFPTKEAALASGVLEKGDLLWIYGTKDNHNAIFYGENSHHDLFWHSAGPNSLGRIDAPGDFRGMWVAKVTQPNKIELRINVNNPGSNAGGFGAKYCVFGNRADAEAAQKNPGNNSIWDKREGTIVLDSKGCGTLRTHLYRLGKAHLDGLPHFQLQAAQAGVNAGDLPDEKYFRWRKDQLESRQRRGEVPRILQEQHRRLDKAGGNLLDLLSGR